MSNTFLEGLAGLVEGVDRGLTNRRERADLEKQRAFELRRYENETRRAAILDALNEEVAKSRLALEERAIKIQEDEATRNAKLAETIPVTVGSKTFELTRQGADALAAMQAQYELQKQNMVPLPTGGFGSPEFYAEYFGRRGEEDARRKFQIKDMLGTIYSNFLQGGMSEQDAKLKMLELGNILFPEEGLPFPEDFMPAEESAVRPGERRGGFLDRLLGIGRGLNPFSSVDPVEQLREKMYGPMPPQTLEELEAARQGRLLEMRGRTNRLMLPPPPPPDEMLPLGARSR